MTEDQFLDLVERIQKAMLIIPFCPNPADVAMLIAEWRRLSRNLAEAEDENDQWQRKVAAQWTETERLRALALEFARGHGCDGDEVDDFARRLTIAEVS